MNGSEKTQLSTEDVLLHCREYQRLRQTLEDAFKGSTLPDKPTAHPALNDLLVRLRLQNL